MKQARKDFSQDLMNEGENQYHDLAAGSNSVRQSRSLNLRVFCGFFDGQLQSLVIKYSISQTLPYKPAQYLTEI